MAKKGKPKKLTKKQKASVMDDLEELKEAPKIDSGVIIPDRREDIENEIKFYRLKNEDIK